MKIGMLWFDNDKKVELAAKVERAVSYYHQKYGTTPTLCFVHPSMLPVIDSPQSAQDGVAQKTEGSIIRTAGVEIRSNSFVLPNHLWIGVNGSLDTQATGA